MTAAWRRVYVLDVGRYPLQQDDVYSSDVSRSTRLCHLLVKDVCADGTKRHGIKPPVLQGAICMAATLL